MSGVQRWIGGKLQIFWHEKSPRSGGIKEFGSYWGLTEEPPLEDFPL